MANEKIVIDKKAVADALYEMGHLIREWVPQDHLTRIGAERRLKALEAAYKQSVEVKND